MRDSKGLIFQLNDGGGINLIKEILPALQKKLGHLRKNVAVVVKKEND